MVLNMDWIDDFIKLYMSKEKGAFGKALDLKRGMLPPKLYRYRSLKNLDYIKNEICNGQIFLSLPCEMNDPFDSRSVLEAGNPGFYAQTKDTYMERFKTVLDDETFDSIFGSDDWLDKLLTHITAKYVTEAEVDAMKEKVSKIMMDEIAKFNSDINDMINKMSRFACFTEKNSNLPMWSHYANGHTGVCIEYDISSISDPYIINRFFPVKYVSKLPDGTLLLAQDKTSRFSFMEYILIHKLLDWSYESEWRLIFNAGSWFCSPDEIPKEFWKNGAPIKFALPSKVFLGAKIEEKNENEIRKWCVELGIPVEKMKCTEYGLISE